MASLALYVVIIFLCVIICGPLSYFLSKINIIPDLIIDFLSCISIVIGLWWLIVIPTFIRFVGLIGIYFGWLAIQNSRKKS